MRNDATPLSLHDLDPDCDPENTGLDAHVNPTPGGVHHILAASSPADERTRVLKHGDTFAVFDHYGDIKRGGLGEEGLYHDGTRFLSCLLLEIEGRRPFFLSSTIRDENDQLNVALTNPNLQCDGSVHVPMGTLHFSLRKFLWNGACYQQLRITNYGRNAVATCLCLRFAADFADIFEVRGMQRAARGSDLSPEVGSDKVRLGYRGLDDVVRTTHLQFNPPPSRLHSTTADFDLSLSPQQEIVLDLSVSCERSSRAVVPMRFDEARSQLQAELQRYSAWSCHLNSSNGQVNAWMNRAASDVHMMTTGLPTGPFPYAGVPWFNTPFGRDGIITAWECLWLRPELARGVLAHLASTQAREMIPEQDAQPGKILHESRRGEMAALREMPFGTYYGSVDSTPLFVMLAGAYFERTGDREFIQELWPHIDEAVEWIDRHGDLDGDGFVEYERQSESGLVHQGWKDSDDAVFHADGSLPEGPIALCEVQSYVYAARRAASTLAAELGLKDVASELSDAAETLRQRFELAFWCDELSTYALALDADKRPCRVLTSNAGHCLFTGIADPMRARKMVRTLLSPAMFSGWGVRTLASTASRYSPIGYHTGCVWPHDNALIAWGLSRYGLGDQAIQIWSGMFEAGMYFDLHRMPELFCGFDQEPGDAPVLYPVACSPQAWSAASVFLLLQACLGLEVNALRKQVSFIRPHMPPQIGELRIHNLEVADSTVDLLLVRHDQDVGVNVLHRQGDVQVVVVK